MNSKTRPHHTLQDGYALSILFLFLAISIISSCAGVHSYPNKVLAGETAVIATGWKHNFSVNDVTVKFIPETGTEIVYLPGDPAIRAILNLYPDPLSSIVISQRTGNNITPGSYSQGDAINFTYTDQDNDWWQTTLFIDVPADLPIGRATVEVTNQVGDTATSTVDVIDSGGLPDEFLAEYGIVMSPLYFNSLSRLDHYVITFTGEVVPEGIELVLDATDFSGYVTQGRGETVNLNWSHDKVNNSYKILLLPAYNGSIQKLQDFKFYVAILGGLESTASLNLNGYVNAYDQSGNPVSGVNATISLERGVYGLF